MSSKSKKSSVKSSAPATVAAVESAPVAVTPTIDNHLAARAVLVQLYIPSVPQYKRDNQATEEVCQAHGVVGGKASARVQKTLLSGPVMNAVNASAQKLRNLHASLTAPWNIGQGIVAAGRIEEVLIKLREAARAYEAAVINLADKIDSIKAEDANRLGTLYRESDYISRETLLAKARATVTVYPVSTDFRTGIVSEAIATETGRAIDAQTAAAKRDLLERLAKVVRHAVSRIGTAHESRFCASNLTNVIDTAEEVVGCLFDGDERLTTLCASLKAEFATLSQLTDALKDEAAVTVREDATAKAKAQLANIEGLMEAFG